MLESARRLSLAALLTGALLALALRPRTAAVGGPVYWAADRDACALIGLDDDLFAVARRPWPWPLALEPAPGGALWVAWAPRGHPGGGQRLARLHPGSGELEGWDVGRLLDLARGPDGGLLWLEERAGLRLLGRRAAGAALRAMPAPPGSAHLAVAAHGLLVGGDPGRVWRFDGCWTPGARLGGPVIDVAAAGDAGWWVLARSQRGASLVALGPDLARRGGVELGTGDGVLAAPGAERVWVAASGGTRGWLLTGAAAPPLEVPLYLPGVSAGIATPDGGALFALPGALVRKGRCGGALPGQGGFDYLVDVVRP